MKAEPFEKGSVSQRWQVSVIAAAAEDEMAKWLFKKVSPAFHHVHIQGTHMLWRSM